jgi:MEMO1 family protein
MSQRKAAVAGSFYPGSKHELIDMLEEFTDPKAARLKALGVISPHAGYIYSGACAGKVFSQVEVPEDVIVLAPNHRGIGADVAVWDEGSWLTPLGEVKVNTELARLIKTECSLVESDESAHKSEHSLEVQLPFLQFLKPGFRLVPLCLLRMSFDNCEDLGKAIAKALKEYGKPALIVASSDMSHYISAQAAKKQDNLALEQVLKLNPTGLYHAVYEHDITMCGFIPASVMLVVAKALGAKEAEVIDYRNSGDVTGDYKEVVAYAGVMVR